METFFGRYRNVLTLALVLLVLFVLLAVQVRPRLPGAYVADQTGVRALRLGVSTIVTPPERALHSGGMDVRGLWSSYVELIGVKEENERLQLENQQMQLEQASLAEDAREGQRLEELLAFKQRYIDTTVPAQVVGSSGSDLERLVNIDKGTADGIEPSMPVMTPDGIVGRIRNVGPHSAQVLLISDPTSATGVLLEQTRTRGVLKGDTAGRPEIVDLIPDDRIKPGQVVLTSGGDQIFPRGLPVGVVNRIVPDVENQPLVDVLLKPAANLSQLEEVLVVTGTAPAPSARARRDLAKSEGAAAAIKAAAAEKAAAAAEAALEAQRASDILAQRLPSASNVENPDAPDAAPGSSPATADSAAAPLHPPSALHADQYSPGAAPKAAELTPGARVAPLAEGTPDTERVVKQGSGEASAPGPSVSPAFKAAHDAALNARAKARGEAVAPAEAVESGEAGAGPVSSARGAGAPGAVPRKPAAPGTVGALPSPLPKTVPGTVPRTVTGPGTPSAQRPAVPSAPRPVVPAAPGVKTRVIEDGPLPAAKPPTAKPPSPAAPKKAGPEIVPDDGSRPPAPVPTPQPQERR